MFGYVTLYRKGLADAEMDRYQAYYCGLCQTLGRRYGRTGQLALSYDMAFVAILLTALYDTPTAFSEGRCVPHPLKKRPRADNELLDYAADMTAALAYYNFLDGRTITAAPVWCRRKSWSQACPPCGSAGRASCRPWPHSWTG